MMQPSERVTGIADRLMNEARVQNLKAGDKLDSDVQRMMNLASSQALLTMAQVLRVTAAELRADEAGNGGVTP
jgi:hypothetical protein